MKKLLIFIVGNYCNLLSYPFPKAAAKTAMRLYSTPRAGRLNWEQANYLSSATQQPLMHNSLQIMSYLWPGREKTILLAHGWESNSSRWQSMVTKLQETGYSIVAIDAPAHGRSGGKLFNGVLYAEFIKVAAEFYDPSIIIGHSVGGMSMIYSHYKYPMPNLEKIVLLAAPSEFNHLMKNYKELMGYNDRVISAIGNLIHERFGITPDEFSVSNFVASFKLEGLIIHDMDDDIIDYTESVAIASSLANSTLIATEAMGHSINTPEVAQHVYDFVKA